MFPNCSCLVFDLNCFSFHCIAESSVGKGQKSNWQAFIIVYADSQRSSQRSGRNVEATSSRLFSVLVGTVWDPLEVDLFERFVFCCSVCWFVSGWTSVFAQVLR